MKSTKPQFDDIALAAVQRATCFVVSVFVRPGQGHWRETIKPDLKLAREVGKAMEGVVANDRLSLVYAITPDGASVLIPRTLDDAILNQSRKVKGQDT